MDTENARHLPIVGQPMLGEPPPLTRDQRRSRRKRVVRAKTVSLKRLSRRALALERAELAREAADGIVYPARPKTRAGCERAMRPCPYVSCTHHLYLDVSPKNGTIKLNFPDLAPEDLEDSCVLDIAARGGERLEDVGALMNLTRERVRQLEERALDNLDAGVRANRKARATLLEAAGAQHGLDIPT